MGMMVNGVWRDVWYDTQRTSGAFVRPDAAFRRRVEAAAGTEFPTEAGRYHLYVSLACPWAHRTLVVRALKGLEAVIPVSVVDPFMGPNGWSFTGSPGTTADRVNGFPHLYQVYERAKPDYTGRVTVPVLWDTVKRTIVNNESSEIIRMFNREFDAFATKSCPDLYPDALRSEIDALNERVYRGVNNGVYRAGFATAQDKYDEAVSALFHTLDWLEEQLSGVRWLVGNRFTEADVRLWTTLVRFDSVYYGHFKCNLRRLVEYPALWAYTRDIYALPELAATVDLEQTKVHYYRSQFTVNPTRIVPAGPVLDFDTPHERARLGPAPI